MKKRKKVVIVVFFLIFISVFMTAAAVEYQMQKSMTRETLKTEVTILSNNIYTLLGSKMTNAYAMAALLEIKPNLSQEDFEIYAKRLYSNGNSSLKNIVFIDDTTITHRYPSEGFEAYIGPNLSLNTEQKKLIELSKSTGKSSVTPRIKLVEGGEGIIIRIPIFVLDLYKGQVSMAFDYDLLMKEIGTVKASEKLDFSIDIKNFNDETPIEIWSNYKFKDDYTFKDSFKLGDSNLSITAKIKKDLDHFSTLFYFLLIFGLSFSTLLAVLLYKQFKLKDEILSTNKKLHDLTIYDELTGLLNRRAFFEDTKKSIENFQSGTIINLDLNGFKYVNDLYGHVYGDQLLVNCSQFFQEKFEDIGVSYRIGGDEFAIVLGHETINESTLDDIKLYLDESLTAFSNIYKVSASVGIITYPNHGRDIKSLFLKADLALQYSKKQTGNTVTSYNDDFFDSFSKKNEIELIINEALENHGFEIYYQPIYDSVTGIIDSFEALIRLKSKAYGPDDFIGIAEETQLIIPLGYWIIKEVFKHIVELNIKINGSSDEGYGFFNKSIAINISSVQLYDSNFVPEIIKMLNTYNIKPSAIEFEITESVFLHKSEALNESINLLRDLGILISLDDFGTGYSSLNYLTYLPLDIIKLDKSLKDKFIDPKYHNVLSGMITMIHGLDMKVVVEGIETQEEQDLLSSLSCDYLQGYHLCRPQPYDYLFDLLSNQ